jgi:hypothetical protein
MHARRRNFACIALASFGIASAALACRQLVGIEDDEPYRGPVDSGGADAPPSDAGSTACGITPANADCRTCLGSKCCAQAQACASDPACAAFSSCTANCQGDPKCRSQCAIDHPTGSSASIAPLARCLSANCETPCGLTCGGTPTFIPPDAAPACLQCAQAQGCASLRACDTDEECQAYILCRENCVTPDCVHTCVVAHEGGVGDFGQLGVAISTCFSDCQWGNQWECVGHVSWPSPTGPTIDLTVPFVLYGVNTKPAIGVNVALCSVADPSCMNPLSSATTDDAGLARLTLLLSSVGGNSGAVYFDVTSSDAGPSIMETLVFPNFPFTAQDARLPNGPALLNHDQVVAAYQGSQIPGPVPGTGIVAVTVADCFQIAAPGVSFSGSGLDGSTQIYFHQGTPTTTVNATDTEGIGGFGNVAPGLVDIVATPKALGAPIGHATGFVRPNAVTTILAQPTP